MFKYIIHVLDQGLIRKMVSYIHKRVKLTPKYKLSWRFFGNCGKKSVSVKYTRCFYIYVLHYSFNSLRQWSNIVEVNICFFFFKIASILFQILLFFYSLFLSISAILYSFLLNKNVINCVHL